MNFKEAILNTHHQFSHGSISQGGLNGFIYKAAIDSGRNYDHVQFTGSPKMSIQELVKKFETFAKRFYTSYNSSLELDDAWLVTDNGYIVLDYGRKKNRVTVFVNTLDSEDTRRAHNLFLETCDPIIQHTGDVHMISRMRDGSYGLNFVGRLSAKFVEENYDDRTQKAYRFVKEQLTSDNPLGRLVLLHGYPGTGKSYFIRSLICDLPDTNTVLIPPSLLGSLSGPELIECITDLTIGPDDSTKRNLLIFEDSDSALVKRESSKSSNVGLSDMLNMSDGLIGEMADLRMLCTTNTDKIDIDPAIIRPGRLCAKVEFKLLEPKQASQIYKRLTGEEKNYSKAVPLSDVYMEAKKMDWSMIRDEDPSKAAPIGGNFI